MTSQGQDNFPRTTLFCIPHAGGNAAFFAGLPPHLPANIECRPLELPGRGRRHREPLHASLEFMAGDLFAHMAPLRGPYALFGHSMGALLALLCALQARECGLPQPRALFISSAAAPTQWDISRPPAFSALPREEFWQRVARLGGMPDDIAASKEFLAYLEPILRADFAALETWEPGPMPTLPLPITVFRGERDMVTLEQAEQWRALTSADFRLHTLAGGHFHLHDNWPELARRICQTLERQALDQGLGA